MMSFGGLVLTGQLFMPKILKDPVDLFTNDINWELPDVDINNPLQVIDAVTAYQQWIGNFITDLTLDDAWARLQLYLPSPAELFDLGDYLSDSPSANTYGGGTSGAPEIKSTARTRPLDETLTAKMTDIFNAAFLEGFVDVQLFSINFSRAEISASASGLRITAEVPWLSGLTGEFEIARRQQNLNTVIRDIAGSPIASRIVAPFLPAGQTAEQAFSVLLDTRITQYTFDLPVAGFEVFVDSGPLGQWLSGSFGLPSNLFTVPGSGNSGVFFGAYSPGFGGAGATGVQRYGGFRLDGQLGVASLVDNAQFIFEIELFNFDSQSSFIFPNFVARASAGSLSLPGLQSSTGLLSLNGFLVEIARQPGGVTVGLSGRLTLLDRLTLVSDGRFTVDLTSGGGIFGETRLMLDGSLSSNATLSGDLYSLSGEYFLEINTTSSPRTIDLPGTPSSDDPVVAAHSGQLRASGSLIAGGFTLNGFFLLRLQSNEFRMQSVATMGFAPFGSMNVSGDIALGPTGIAGSLILNGGAQLTRRGSGIEAQAVFQLDINTRPVPLSVSRPGINAGTGEISGTAAFNLPARNTAVFMAGRLQFIDQYNALSFAMFGGFSAAAGQLRLPGGTIESGLQIEIITAVLRLTAGSSTLANLTLQGALLATSGGVSARASLGAGTQILSPTGAGYSFSGVFTLEVNSRTFIISPIGSTP